MSWEEAKAFAHKDLSRSKVQFNQEP